MSSDAFTTLDAEAEEMRRLARLEAKRVRPTFQPAGPALVEVEDLHVRFGENSPEVIRGISFEIHRGECLALIGESGSGKSVTSRALAGLNASRAHTTARKLSFDREDLRHFNEARWRALRGGRIGFVMQDALGSLDPLRTVGSEIAEALRLHTPLDRKQREEKVIQLLRAAGVPEPEVRARQHPHQLSGGLRQRALIAAALACDPELLIADEPTTALDAAVQRQVLDLLKSLRSPGNAMLVVSHDFAVVSHLADTVAVMHRGQIVEYGPIEAVLQDPHHAYTKSLLLAVKAVHRRSKAQPPSAARPPLQISPSFTDRRAEVPILELANVSKRFPGPNGAPRTVVSGVSLQLFPGETLGLVGESGSGKTTTLRLALGLETPDEGVANILGSPWASLSAEEKRRRRQRVQVVFQDPLGSFDPRYTVDRILDEALELTGVPAGKARTDRALQLMSQVHLPADLYRRRPLELSGGQRQRLAIARALAPEPNALVCDEPVSALDVSVQKQILDLLEELKASLGLACLFVSHDLGVIQRISDRVLVMKDGAVVESGPAHAIFPHAQHPYTRTLLAAIPILEFAGNAIDI